MANNGKIQSLGKSLKLLKSFKKIKQNVVQKSKDRTILSYFIRSK